MLFIIPQPIAPAGDASPFPGAPFSAAGRFATFAAPQTDAPPDPMAPHNQPAAPNPIAAPAEPELLHIPCPNGHELETPVDMLDQDVLCPQCNKQFRLRRKDSIEYKAKKERDERLRLEKVGNLWLNWAIAAVVLVVLGLITLVVVSQLNQ